MYICFVKIVDTNIELAKHINQLNSERVLVFPILTSLEKHPILSRISSIIISDGTLDLFVNYHNIDATGVTDNIDFGLFKEVFIVGMKEFLYHNQYSDNMYDAELSLFHQAIEIDIDEHPITTVFRRRKAPKANDLIPIWKHYEQFQKWLTLLPQFQTSKFAQLYPIGLHWIETAGLYTPMGIEYTQYNPYTTTSRPSNTFGGVNYAALRKDDDTRSRFISRFEGGRLVQFDFDGYHIRLIGKLIGESIPLDIKAHKWLANQYGVPMKDAKPITFRQLYGGVQDEYKHIPFFQKVSEYIDGVWFNYMKDGYILTPLLKRKMVYDSEMNKNKLFNYILQSFETERNIYIIEMLQNSGLFTQSVPILYTYDSILFDISPNNMDIIPEIKSIMGKGGFPVDMEIGTDYKNMNK